MTGKTLSHYEILGQLGEGGMGVVYKARDTRLNRFVAIKVLPHDKVADPERKRRFIQEAQAASALNHPNIITIYDIDQADGVDFIAMEYVGGQTLGERIGGKALPLGEALKYAVQIADALAAAHGAGIIHRDLKPGNVMVTEKGAVKVLDFGLAKLTEHGAEVETTISNHPHTQEGAVVGTAAYMSPEQAEGKKVDARSDVFSFGLVLYEMVTGKRAFLGDSRMSTLAAVLREEPKPVSELVPDVPRDLDKLLARCLRKDPERRAKDMGDLKLLLEEMKEEWSSGSFAAARPADAVRSRRLTPLVIGGLLLVIAAAGGAWWVGHSRAPAPSGGPALTRLVADPGLNTDPALSPDGKLLAYASDRGGNGSLDIWVRQLAGGEPLRLTDHEADDYEPVFSPDGSQIAFRSERDGGGIYVVSALGGQARRIVRQGGHPRYSPAGDQIAYSVGGASQEPIHLYVAPATGGAPWQLQAEFYQASRPVWSPDGKHLLFTGRPDRIDLRTSDWWVTPVEGGKAVRTNAFAVFRKTNLGAYISPSAWVSGPDRILFSARSGDTTNLWEVPISPMTFEIAGAPRRLTFGTGLEASPSIAQESPRVAFADLNQTFDLWGLPLDPNGGKVTGEPMRLTEGPSSASGPFVSADGRKMGFNRAGKGGKLDLWLKELPSGKETPLFVSPVPNQYGCISPDGSRVAYVVTENQASSLYVIPAAGGEPERLGQRCGPPNGWSPDGQLIVYETAGNRALVLLDVASGQKTEILKHPKYGVSRGRFSADGKWLSFHAIPGPAARRVYVAPFRGAVLHDEKDWIPITDGEGMERYADWSPDGNVLYFLSERDGFRCIRGQRLNPATKHPLGPPFDVYHFHHARRSLGTVDPIGISPTVARDKIVFSMIETTGGIWMATLDRR